MKRVQQKMLKSVRTVRMHPGSTRVPQHREGRRGFFVFSFFFYFPNAKKLLSSILFFGVIVLFGGMSLKINSCSCLMLFVIMESKIAFYTLVEPFLPCL
ncbi:hypothetical protein HanRHA438_Chr10g0454791 [Helianthus annuus]|nr:hypothetical protein HanRHA438_Chr10g0454791 [Helianthus annuus]